MKRMKKALRYAAAIVLDFSLIGHIAAEENYTLGDINSDGYITNNDRYALNQYLSETSASSKNSVHIQAADINRDGLVTETDYEILSRHLAGWEGYENLDSFAEGMTIDTVVVDKAAVMTNETITISAVPAGQLKYSADVYWNGVKIDHIVGESKLQYIPMNPGQYSFDVTVTDNTEKKHQFYLDNCVRVKAYWNLDDVVVNSDVTEVGNSVTISAITAGDSSDLTYYYTIYYGDTVCYELAESDSETLDFMTSNTGTYYAKAAVSDSYGETHSIKTSGFEFVNTSETNLVYNVNSGTTLDIDDLHEKDGDEVIVADSTLTLTWDKLSGDSYYELYVSGTDGSEIHVDDYTSNTYKISSSSIQPGYEYTVELFRYDSNGKRLTSVERWFDFLVYGAESILLEKKPQFIVPKTNQTYLYEDFTVSWNRLNYASKYVLTISYHCGKKYHEISEITLDGNAASYTIPKSELHIGCKHKVKLAAYDTLGNKISINKEFEIAGDEKLYRIDTPVITTPEFSDGINYRTYPVYEDIPVTWEDILAAQYYSVELYDVTKRTDVSLSGAENIKKNQYLIPVSRLSSGHVYRVTVYAYHTSSCKEESDTLYFRAPYPGNKLLDPPVVISHVFSEDVSEPSAIVRQDLNIVWEPVSAAVKYDVDWYWMSDEDYPDFTSYGQTSESVTIPRSEVGNCTNGNEYYILQITAYDSNGNTESQKYYVKPLESTISPPVLLSPSFSTDRNADYPAYEEEAIDITWSVVPEAVSYRVRLYEYYDGDWDEVYTKEGITGTTAELPERWLYSGGKYKVTVRAYDPYGNARSSDAYYFQIGSSKHIGLTLNEWSAPYEEAHKYVTVETAGKWTASVSDSWISLSAEDGEGTGRIKIDVTTNNSDFVRIGTITFKNTYGGRAVLTITQAPNGEDNTGALKITAPLQGDTIEYGSFTAKWNYPYTHAYFKLVLDDISVEETVFSEDMTVAKNTEIPVSALIYGHTYQLTISVYDTSDRMMSESSVVFKVETFDAADQSTSGGMIEEEPEISGGETTIILSGLKNDDVVEKKDIDISWKPVIGADYYYVALRDMTEYPDEMDDADIIKTVDKTTRILKEKITSGVLIPGHNYRLWVAAHDADDTLITGKSYYFRAAAVTQSTLGIPSTDFDDTSLSLIIGNPFTFNGTVYANGGTLEQVRVTVKEISTGSFCDYAVYDAAAIASFGSSTSFDLSNIYGIVTGAGTSIETSGSGYADAASQSLSLCSVGDHYVINIYTKNVGGELLLAASKQITLSAMPFVRIYDAGGNDLNGTVLNVDYSAFYRKTIYVETNTDISAWNDSSNAFTMNQIDVLYKADCKVYTYHVQGTQNPSGTERQGELRIYETSTGNVTAASKKWASIQVVQAANPNIIQTRHRVLLFGTNTGVQNSNGTDAGITFVSELEKIFKTNIYVNGSLEITKSTFGQEDVLLKMIDAYASTGCDSDITYICCMSHGYEGGLGIWNGSYHWSTKEQKMMPSTKNISYETLFQRISKIPGKIVFITGACHSGSCISEAQKYGDKVTVLAATNNDQLSWRSDEKYMYQSAANVIFIDGLISAATEGDANGDGMVTVLEAFEFAKKFSDESVRRIQNSDVLPPYKRTIVGTNTLFEELLVMMDKIDYEYAIELMDPKYFGNNPNLPLWGIIK